MKKPLACEGRRLFFVKKEGNFVVFEKKCYICVLNYAYN